MKRNGRPKESALGYSQKIVGETGDSYQTAQKTDEKRKTSLEKMVYQTAQVSHGDGGRKKKKD